jgi:hypothetical protein
VSTVVAGVPTIDLVAIDDVINLAEVGTTLTGTNIANSSVALSIGGVTRPAVVSGTTWSYTLVADDITAMGQGPKTLSATQTDTAGNVSAAGTRGIVVDTQLPTTTANVTAITDNVGIVTGTVTSGATTDDTVLGVSGTLTVALATGETVRIYDNGTYLGNATVALGASTWTYTDTRTAVPPATKALRARPTRRRWTPW